MSPPSFVRDIALGPLMGTLCTMLLYGMTVMQVYLYYSRYPSDPVRLKALVAVILALESLTLALACHFIYYYLVLHYGEVEFLVHTVWSVWLSDETGFIVAWLVNMFFVRRIYILSNHKLWLVIIIGTLATIRPAFGFTATTFAYQNPLWVVFHQRVQWMFITGLSIGLATDFLIASTVSFYLIKGRENSMRSTRNIVNVLLWYTINTTAILAFFAVLEMIFLLVQPHTLVFLGLFQIQIQLYANCFLASLNAREALRKPLTDITPMVTVETWPRNTQNLSHTTSTTAGLNTTKTASFIVNDPDRAFSNFEDNEKPGQVV